jgi:hypothetical protein
MSKTLFYNGSGFRVGIPSRDLTGKEIEDFGGEAFLLSTGLFDLDPASGKAEIKKPRSGRSSIVEEKEGSNE